MKPWLDETSDADEFERSILRAGLDADPSQSTQEQIWSSLVGALPVAPSVALTAASPAIGAKSAAVGISKASTVSLAITKGFVVGLAVYGATAGAVALSERLTSPSALDVAAPQVTPPPKPKDARSEAPAQTPTPAIDGGPAKSHAIPGNATSALGPPSQKRELEPPAVASFNAPEPPSGRQTSQLDAETRALRRARDELRSGKLADARTTLETSQRRFSAPELYQEREALMIELLYRGGQKPAAAERAQVFLSRFPESPHAQQVQLFAGR